MTEETEIMPQLHSGRQYISKTKMLRIMHVPSSIRPDDSEDCYSGKITDFVIKLLADTPQKPIPLDDGVTKPAREVFHVKHERSSRSTLPVILFDKESKGFLMQEMSIVKFGLPDPKIWKSQPAFNRILGRDDCAFKSNFELFQFLKWCLDTGQEIPDGDKMMPASEVIDFRRVNGGGIVRSEAYELQSGVALYANTEKMEAFTRNHIICGLPPHKKHWQGALAVLHDLHMGTRPEEVGACFLVLYRLFSQNPEIIVGGKTEKLREHLNIFKKATSHSQYSPYLGMFCANPEVVGERKVVTRELITGARMEIKEKGDDWLYNEIMRYNKEIMKEFGRFVPDEKTIAMKIKNRSFSKS